VGEQLKIVGFAAAVCLVCSVLLACVSTILGPRQEINKANDIRIKVLQVFGEPVTDESGRLSMSLGELDSLFAERIKGIVLDADGNELSDRTVADLTVEQINERNSESGVKACYPLYIYNDPDKGLRRYALHISGKGLWSTIKGYMALEDDLSTIAGVVFYEHQETPGLGGEVEKPYFQDSFKGKQWLVKGKVQKFRITKPGAEPSEHAVDGITAATMTCNGVESFLNDDFSVYNRYFEKLRSQR
jgi:Na+-transporting NADH:ubiquinone oxidoreductase subunit C